MFHDVFHSFSPGVDGAEWMGHSGDRPVVFVMPQKILEVSRDELVTGTG